MEAKITNKEKGDIIVQQYEKSFKGRPVVNNSLLLQSRLSGINDVIARAYVDNVNTLAVEFQLTLPDDAWKQRQSTMTNDKILKQFIRYLTPEIESETPITEEYTPNTLRFVARKVYMSEHKSYYSYNVCALVNGEIFEDIATCSRPGGSLIDKIIKAWVSATGLGYPLIKGTFNQQNYPSLTLDNLSEKRNEHYNNIHYRLSTYASVGRGNYLLDKDAFCCSDN